MVIKKDVIVCILTALFSRITKKQVLFLKID